MKMTILALIFGFMTYNTPDGMPVEGVEVHLYGLNCATNESIDTVETDEDGLYVFYDVDLDSIYFIYPDHYIDYLQIRPYGILITKKDIKKMTEWEEEYGFTNMDVDLDGNNRYGRRYWRKWRYEDKD